MTIDKFGRHIHKHVLKKHLQSEDVLRHFLKQSQVRVAIQELVGRVLMVSATTPKFPQKTILTLHGDGTLSAPLKKYKLVNKGDKFYYSNQLYAGRIVNVRYSDATLLQLQVGARAFDINEVDTNPYLLRKNTSLSLVYIGPSPVPDQTKAIFVEVEIE